tara:strand:+ start:8533 stop:9972 length:1440 start_codon:yes stop_codon:yes gene_type:complete
MGKKTSFQQSKKPNILFIVMDGIRPQNLSHTGYKRNTSPNIDTLANQGVSFTNCFSSHNVTYKSILSILGGRHLLEKGELSPYHTSEEMQAFFETEGKFLQEILRENNYKTFCLKKVYSWQKTGFDYFHKQEPRENLKKWKWIRKIKKSPIIYKISKYIFHYLIPKNIADKIRADKGSENTTDEAIKIIKQHKTKPFFMWIDYADTHDFISPPPFNTKFKSEKLSPKFFKVLNLNKKYNKKEKEFLKGVFKSNETINDIIARYDNALAYNDYLMGKIIKTLKQENILDNTIIFFLSDHGQSLDEHKLYFTHEGLFDISLRVPLIISGKNIPKNKKLKILSQLEDIPPTVLDLLNIPYENSLFDGKSLFSALSGTKKEIRDIIFAEERATLKRRAIRTPKYKYMESPEKEFSICTCCGGTHGGRIGLYNLEKDPEEKINIAKQNPKVLLKMKKKFNKYIKDLKTTNEKRRINYKIKSKNL